MDQREVEINEASRNINLKGDLYPFQIEGV